MSTFFKFQAVKVMDKGDAQTQVLIRTLHKKPGLKDTNFQVLKAKLEAVKYIAENFTITVYVINSSTCTY